MRTVHTKFLVARLRMDGDFAAVVPLLIPARPHLGTSPVALASQFGLEARDHIDEGDFLELTKYIGSLDLDTTNVQVVLPADESHGRPHDLPCPFELHYTAVREDLLLGFVPVLGLESSGTNLEELRTNVVESLRQEFARHGRDREFARLLPALWWEESRVETWPLDLKFPTPAEQESEEPGERASLIKSATEPMIAADRVFGRERESRELARVLRGRQGGGALIVGPNGAGKTTLVQALHTGRADLELADLKMRVSSAARLVRVLTDDGGWQLGLMRLCDELVREDTALFIRNLSELFESGQYIGNNVSIGEYLREYVSGGRLTLITECTPEELARIETLSPGFSGLFHTIRLDQPAADRLLDITRRKLDFSRPDRVADEAVKEALRLQMRFMPYSGYPGKTIRFLEALVDERAPDTEPVNARDVVTRFCEESGMPVFMVSPDEPMDPDEVRERFARELFGQDAAVETVIDVLFQVKTALGREGRPIASLLFAGPTGVGKTETARLLADFMFGRRDAFLRFDMSEFGDYGSVLRLIGMSAREDGLLTGAVRRDPFAVVLFDELEKAHPSFFDLLLQVLGEGRLTDARGQTADFGSTIIIMTSNVGAGDFGAARPGFARDEDEARRSREHFNQAARDFFRPELFNRLDRIAAYHPLDRQAFRQVVRREARKIQERPGLKFRPIRLDLTDAALDWLAERGHSPRYGARGLQRVLQQELLTPLGRELNRYRSELPLDIVVRPSASDRLEFETKPNEARRRDAVLQENDARELAGRVTSRRRQAARIEEGDTFVRLLNELDILAGKRKKMGDAFFIREKRPERLDILGKLKYEFLELFARIGELELLALPVGLRGEENSERHFLDWETDYLDACYRLFAEMNETGDRIVLGIYGAREYLQKMTDLYDMLIERMQFDWTGRHVWHREGEDDYVETIYAEPAAPERKGDLLVGVEMFISGRGVPLFFNDEVGLHEYVSDEQRGKYLLVKTVGDSDALNRPDGLHRRQIYDQLRTRRIYRAEDIVDGSTVVHFEPGQREERLFEWLLERYRKRIMNVLTDNDPEEEDAGTGRG